MNGKPWSVGICYWLGSHRDEEEQFCNLGYAISPDLKKLTPDGEDAERLDKGRMEFIKWIDEMQFLVD